MSGPGKTPNKRTSISPVTLRMTPDERERLEDLAAGMTLSAYIRACIFAKEAKRRKSRPNNVVADMKATAEALALLGQSRIASNLNQFAYHANIGALEAVESYEAHGAVAHRWNRDTALAALVEDYMSDVELNGTDISRLAFAHRRKDVYAINQAIRSAIRSTTGNSAPVTLCDTETGPRAFARGDRIVFTRNDKSIGVKNGMLGTVTKATRHQITVNLDNDDGKRCIVTFNPGIYQAFDHGYAVTIHKSQGATVDRSYVLASRTMDEPLTYVAMTRHREDMRLYLNGQDQPVWAERMDWANTHRGIRRSGPSLG